MLEKITNLLEKIGRKFINFVLNHKFLVCLIVGLLIFVGMIVYFVRLAFSSLGDMAYAIVITPASLLFLGLMVFLADLSTPEGREKHKRRFASFKKALGMNKSELRMVSLFLLFVIDLTLFVVAIVLANR